MNIEVILAVLIMIAAPSSIIYGIYCVLYSALKLRAIEKGSTKYPNHLLILVISIMIYLFALPVFSFFGVRLFPIIYGDLAKISIVFLLLYTAAYSVRKQLKKLENQQK